ncbi:hypothetical protein AVEN_102568-1 [Araneus ventricosus]|uniref:Uncharacterized protein n=1 Tax=Araneus ventricosus TaxID=182803 RepID=A0A4Y2BIZ6_ARAVE|nr:hypothetical protein AVEN_102568-1 [Araneus ventricosus]
MFSGKNSFWNFLKEGRFLTFNEEVELLVSGFAESEAADVVLSLKNLPGSRMQDKIKCSPKINVLTSSNNLALGDSKQGGMALYPKLNFYLDMEGSELKQTKSMFCPFCTNAAMVVQKCYIYCVIMISSPKFSLYPPGSKSN